MIQSSIHSLSDCSFSPLCPAALPHCHSGFNERSGSHGWYSCCYCAFIGDSRVCCFVICSESKNRAPRVLICNGLSLLWPWQILDSQSSWTALGLLQGPHGAQQPNEEESNALVWHTQYYCSENSCALLSALCQNQIKNFMQILAMFMCL